MRYDKCANLHFDIHDRINSLLYGEVSLRIAYIYPVEDYGTFRYRCYNMCQALGLQKKASASYFFVNELEFLVPFLNKIDAVVFCRVPWDLTLENFIYSCQSIGLSVIYDTDDLVFNLDYIPLLINYLDQHKENDFWVSYVARRHMLAKMCDAYIGTNEILVQELLLQFKGKPSFMIPNFLNLEQIAYSEELFKTRSICGDKEQFSIGYFSGTGTHNQDFMQIARDVFEILKRYQKISMTIVGYLEIPKILDPFIENGQIKRKPLVNFLELQKEISLCDINLIPLVDSVFTRCKSNLKFFESAVVGTVSVATANEVYASSIKNNKTGFLVEGEPWFDVLDRCYENRKELYDVSRSARNVSLNYYGPANQSFDSFLDFIKMKRKCF